MLALLFTQPRSDVFASLDRRGDVLDGRAGATWDLFFPGYYRVRAGERKPVPHAKPVGSGFASDWYYDAVSFNEIVARVEDESGYEFRYQTGSQLVLANVTLRRDQDPEIHWSTLVVLDLDRLAHHYVGDGDALEAAVGSITIDQRTGRPDPKFGVSDLQRAASGKQDAATLAKSLAMQALPAIFASLFAQTFLPGN